MTYTLAALADPETRGVLQVDDLRPIDRNGSACLHKGHLFLALDRLLAIRTVEQHQLLGLDEIRYMSLIVDTTRVETGAWSVAAPAGDETKDECLVIDAHSVEIDN